MQESQNEILASSSSETSLDSDGHTSLSARSLVDGMPIARPGEPEGFLVMGLSKGNVIFVRADHIDHIEHIYARFSVHK